MQQIESFGVLQTSKVVSAVYFILGLLVVVITAIFAIAARKGPVRYSGGLVMLLLAPIFYGLAGFIFTAIFCWLYNAVAKRLGGIEIELSSHP